MKTIHYASLEINGIDVHGTAELVTGSGYLFRREGERQAALVSYTDPSLLLYGLKPVADAQWAADHADGTDLAALADGRAA